MAYVNRTNAESGVNLLALRSHNAALVLDLLRTAGEGGIEAGSNSPSAPG